LIGLLREGEVPAVVAIAIPSEMPFSRRAEQHFSPIPALESVCDAGTEASTGNNAPKG